METQWVIFTWNLQEPWYFAHVEYHGILPGSSNQQISTLTLLRNMYVIHSECGLWLLVGIPNDFQIDALLYKASQINRNCCGALVGMYGISTHMLLSTEKTGSTLYSHGRICRIYRDTGETWLPSFLKLSGFIALREWVSGYKLLPLIESQSPAQGDSLTTDL